MAITLTQSTQVAATGSATTSVIAYGSNVAGTSLLVAVAYYGANTTCTFTDDNGGSWSTLGPFWDSGIGQAIAIGYAANHGAGATTVTATYGVSSSFRTLQISEWAGAATTSVLDTNTTGQHNATSTTPSDASMSTAINGELVVGGCGGGAGNAATAGTGFTVVQTDAVNGIFSEYQVQTTAGSISCAYNISPSQTTVTISAAFKPAGGAAGGGRPVTPGRTWQRRYRHRQTRPSSPPDVTLPPLLPIVVVGATPTPVAQAPVIGRGSLFDAATPPPVIVNPRPRTNAGQVLLGRGSLADDPVLTTRAPIVAIGPAAAVVAQPAFLARSSLADVAAVTAATPGPIVASAPLQRAATPQAFIGRSSLTDAATPGPIVVAATAQRPVGTARILRATLADDPVLTTRAPVVVTGAAATVVTPAPYVSRSSLVDVAPSTIATPQPIIVTPPPRLPIAPAPILARGALQDDPQLTTPAPVIVAAPLRVPITPQAFLARASLADVVASTAATPQPIVVIGPAVPRASVQPYLARSSFADSVSPAPIVVAAALKRAAAQPPIVLRATLTDPPMLTTASAIVIAAPFRPARTHPFLSRGSLTAAPAPSGLIGNIGYIGEGPEVGAITQPAGGQAGGNAGMTQSQEVGAVTYDPPRHVIGKID